MWFVINVANQAILKSFVLRMVVLCVVEGLVGVLHVAGRGVSHVGVPTCWFLH